MLLAWKWNKTNRTPAGLETNDLFAPPITTYVKKKSLNDE
jgi:hypothetical protein